MKLPSAALCAVLVGFSTPAGAEVSSLGRVVLETSRVELEAPGRLGLAISFFDTQGRPIPATRVPPHWDVRLTSDGATLAPELAPSTVRPTLEGDVLLRRSGRHRLRAEVHRPGASPVRSAPVRAVAVAPLDLGVVRAGETVCSELPGGGRGLAGEVIEGELPEGLRLWGACLVAEDSVVAAAGTFRGEVVVMVGGGTGRRAERRIYDVSYRLEPRLLTPRRAFFGFGFLALLGMLAAVMRSVRRRPVDFGHGAVLAWAEVESSPYRGDRAPAWSVVPLDGGAPSVIDLGVALGVTAVGPGVLKMRPTDDGQVEFVVPRSEEIRAKTPDGRPRVGRRRLAVPFGSTVSFRSLALAPLMGDDAARAVRGDAIDR